MGTPVAVSSSSIDATSTVPDYSVILLTYKRVQTVAQTLQALLGQTRPPSLLVLVDNDPDRSAESLIASFAEQTAVRLAYLPMERNVGPAGGWARGAMWASSQPDRGEWLMVCDDDDPPAQETICADLLRLAEIQETDVAAVGLRGACFDKIRARLIRQHPSPGSPKDVDYLASNGLPLYRWRTIEPEGFFDEDFFFGFEDLDYGLRLRANGYRLVVVEVPSASEVADSGATGMAWREYYKTRALIAVCRRHFGVWVLIVTLLRSITGGTIRFAVIQRRPKLARARLFGAMDGLRGLLGIRRWDPAVNDAKPT